MTQGHLERRIEILITNQKSKINIVLDKIRNFLLNPKTQPSPLLEQLQSALTQKENHKKSHKEKQTLTFQFDKNLEMIGILFLTFPFSEKKRNGEEPVFVIDWSLLEQFQEDEYYVTITNLEKITSVLEQIQKGETLSQEDESCIIFFFNIELEKLLNFRTIYFANSYLRTWNGEVDTELDSYTNTEIVRSPNLFISSNFLTKEDVLEVYDNFKNLEPLYIKLNLLTEKILDRKNLKYSYSFYPLWEKHNREFKKVKRDLFEYNRATESYYSSLLWSTPNSVFELYHKWNKLLKLELTGDELEQLNNRICCEMTNVLKYHEKILTSKLKMNEETIEFVKFLKNFLFLHLYKTTSYDCGATFYSEQIEASYIEVADIVFHLLNNSRLSHLILEQIQEEEELPVTVSYSKYFNLVGKNKVFLSSLNKIIKKKNVKVTIIFESLNMLFGADSNVYTKPLEELTKLKEEFSENIQIIFSEDDKRLIEKFIQIHIHSSDKQKDKFKRANNFLEVFNLK